jgi:protein subunit release factor B
MSQYRNYLLAKNKAQEKNLNSYRTQYETSDAESVLNGNLDGFVQAELKIFE